MNTAIEREDNIEYIYSGEKVDFDVMIRLLCESLEFILKTSKSL